MHNLTFDMTKYGLFCNIFFWGSWLMSLDARCQPPKYQTTIDMAVPFMASPVVMDKHPVLYYELHLTNYAKDSVALKDVTVLNANDGSIIERLDSAGLTVHFATIGQAKKGSNLYLAPGGSGVIFWEIRLASNHGALVHQVELSSIKNGLETRVVTKGGTVNVAEQPPVLIGSPLGNGPWAAVYNPLWPTGHRRVFYTIGGAARLPGRYAIDFIKLDSVGRYAKDNTDSIGNWLGYGAGVYAVADGIVASTRTDMKESSTLSGYTPASPENATGNYISIKIAEGCFAFYEHLKPGSILVSPGQKVKKGDKIAALGFTGQTTGPHLHFHIANMDSPLGAEGIPFVFESFRLMGNYPHLESFGKQRWEETRGRTLERITRERPAPQSVIDFGPR
jgi:murein DD-endopeptidase MepM/ murein hydrolase activator NlpD